MVEVSIVLRTKNEAVWLPQTLTAIRGQSRRADEILVVDSGSTDGTLELVRGQADLRLITIPPQAFTYGRALNLGMRESTGRALVCLSAHAVPCDPEWLDRLLQPLHDPRIAAVYGRQVARPDASPSLRRDYLTWYAATPRTQSSLTDHFFSNANAAIRRELWERFGFDETMPFAEDQLWARAVLGAKYAIAYEPRAAVYHSHNEGLTRVYRRAVLEAMGFRRLHPDHPFGVVGCLRQWLGNTRGDIAFIRRSGDGAQWIPCAAAFRLAQSLGRLRASMGRS